MKKTYKLTATIELEEITPDTPVVTDPPPVTDPPVVVDPPSSSRGAAARIGVNAFHWIPLDKLKMFSTIRLYISSAWIWRPNGLFVQPLWQAETAKVSGLDDYFTAAKQAGIEVIPCINQTPEWFRPSGSNNTANDYPPVKEGLSRTDPKSYADYADFWFQFVARYGSVKHPDAVLKVDTTPKYTNQPLNVKKSGLGLISTVEIGNEWDRWWDAPGPKYMKPEEQAAMMIAVYDAVKRADPNVKVVMGGLTGLDYGYMQKFLAAGGKCDVLNVHHYSNVGNKAGVWPPTWETSGACFPEWDAAFDGFEKMVGLSSLGKPLWCTEFGADTVGGNSWMHIKGSRYGLSDEEAQAELIIRSYLLQLAYGVERSYCFTAIDEPASTSGNLWQSCGLMTSEATGFKEKPSYKAVKWLLDELEGYELSGYTFSAHSTSIVFQKGEAKKTFSWRSSSGDRVKVA